MGSGRMVSESKPADQPQLLRSSVRRRTPPVPEGLAEVLPVARVAVEMPLTHLDRCFDYGVPASMSERAVPGARVRVRFAGALVDGYVLERVDRSDHEGRLTPLHRVPSGEVVLTPQVLALARAVADRYAGTLADVLRLAVPPRHAATEKTPASGTAHAAAPGPEQTAAHGDGPWSHYPAGASFLARLRSGGRPRAVWTVLSGTDWPHALALATAATVASGRGALLVLPDRRDVDRVDAALTEVLGGSHVRLTADAGVAARYRAFLALSRGEARVAVGTRAAMFAPVRNLGLVAVWDDGDDLHAEPRAPYPHVREVLRLRADQSGAAALVAGHSRTAEAQRLVELGWAREVVADRATVRARAPRVVVSGDDIELARDAAAAQARLPALAWRTLQEGLARGPVLVQTPRAGYLPALGCQRCRASARCSRCSGPLTLGSGAGVPSCRWCGHPAADWCCPVCAGRQLRSVVVGSARTAEELGRAFPGVTVRSSGGEHVLADVPDRPALVVATPGAEPVAAAGYAAAVLLDTWALLARPDLRAAEEALRRWTAVVALTRSAGSGGTVVLVGEPAVAPVQALVRHDPAGHAARELAERTQLGLPPATRTATVTGSRRGVDGLLAVTDLPAGTDVLGPVPVEGRRSGGGAAAATPAGAAAQVRVVLRAAVEDDSLALALRAGAAVRSARREPDPVRVQVDPLELG